MRSAADELATILRRTEAKSCGSGRHRAGCLCDPGRNKSCLSIQETGLGWVHHCFKGECTPKQFRARAGLLSTHQPKYCPQPRMPIYRGALAPEAEDALARFEHLPPATTHAYLVAKGIPAVPSLRVDGHDLAVPMFDEDGVLRNLQRIYERRGGLIRGGRLPSRFEKRFLKGLPTHGLFLPIGERTRCVRVAEGVATGISVHVSSGDLTLVAFSAAHLAATAVIAAHKYRSREVVICADNDAKVAA